MYPRVFLTSATALCACFAVTFAFPASILPRQRLPPIGSGPRTADDGSRIIENQVIINGLNMRFKVSAPESALVSAASAQQGGKLLGINLLLHGDGGQSFFDFPNAGVDSGLMGVALLSPDPDLRWGGSDPRNSLLRPQGPEHSAAINQFLTTELPKLVNFDRNKIFMEGISGGSLLLSGFMIPTFGASLAVPGVIMGCGGLPPQVEVQGDISGIRVHWQTTVDENANLQQSIPRAISAYEQIASNAGLSNSQINLMQTVDASPNGGHCAFDEQGFVSGVQLLTDNYANILLGEGNLNGAIVGGQGVVGNENPFNGNGNSAGSTTGRRGRGRRIAAQK